MKKILIVQSLNKLINWNEILEQRIKKEFPEAQVDTTDSFDHALDLIPKDGEPIIITCHAFRDQVSDHWKHVNMKIFDSYKNGIMLAKMIKDINPHAKVYIFSSEIPAASTFVDGFILKGNKETREESIKSVMDAIRTHI